MLSKDTPHPIDLQAGPLHKTNYPCTLLAYNFVLGNFRGNGSSRAGAMRPLKGHRTAPIFLKIM